MENGFGGVAEKQHREGWKWLQHIRREMRVWTSMLLEDTWTLGWPFVKTVDKYENKNPACCEWRGKAQIPSGMAEQLNQHQQMPIPGLPFSQKQIPICKSNRSQIFLLLVANTLPNDTNTILCQALALRRSRNKTYCIPTSLPVFSWSVELRNVHSKLKKTKIFQCLDESMD